MKYTKIDGGILGKGTRDVVVDCEGGAHFLCPCDQRPVYVTSPPHGIEFDSHGVLTLKGSRGYAANERLERPANWCHFSIADGVPSMHSDSKCPGSRI